MARRLRNGAMALALLLSGCHRHYAVKVPGCIGANVNVGPGCYVVQIPKGIEVRCPKVTTRYHCEH